MVEGIKMSSQEIRVLVPICARQSRSVLVGLIFQTECSEWVQMTACYVRILVGWSIIAAALACQQKELIHQVHLTQLRHQPTPRLLMLIVYQFHQFSLEMDLQLERDRSNVAV